MILFLEFCFWNLEFGIWNFAFDYLICIFGKTKFEMKRLFIVFAFAFSLASCTFTEEITINPDGTGKYNLGMDGSALMAMMPKDSAATTKNMDSTFTFKELFDAKKDSIAKMSPEKQAKIKNLENFIVKMKMNYDTKEFLFSLNSSFKSVADLQNVLNDLSEVQNMAKGSQGNSPVGAMDTFSGNGANIKYAYDGKKFSRKAMIDKSLMKKINKDSLEAYKAIFESSKYVIKYHFPKPVKKVSNKTALFSEDKKTITIEYAFNEYMNEPEKLNFEVEFVK